MFTADIGKLGVAILQLRYCSRMNTSQFLSFLDLLCDSLHKPAKSTCIRISMKSRRQNLCKILTTPATLRTRLGPAKRPINETPVKKTWTSSPTQLQIKIQKRTETTDTAIWRMSGRRKNTKIPMVNYRGQTYQLGRSKALRRVSSGKK